MQYDTFLSPIGIFTDFFFVPARVAKRSGAWVRFAVTYGGTNSVLSLLLIFPWVCYPAEAQHSARWDRCSYFHTFIGNFSKSWHQKLYKSHKSIKWHKTCNCVKIYIIWCSQAPRAKWWWSICHCNVEFMHCKYIPIVSVLANKKCYSFVCIICSSLANRCTPGAGSV